MYTTQGCDSEQVFNYTLWLLHGLAGNCSKISTTPKTRTHSEEIGFATGCFSFFLGIFRLHLARFLWPAPSPIVSHSKFPARWLLWTYKQGKRGTTLSACCCHSYFQCLLCGLLEGFTRCHVQIHVLQLGFRIPAAGCRMPGCFLCYLTWSWWHQWHK